MSGDDRFGLAVKAIFGLLRYSRRYSRRCVAEMKEERSLAP